MDVDPIHEAFIIPSNEAETLKLGPDPLLWPLKDVTRLLMVINMRRTEETNIRSLYVAQDKDTSFIDMRLSRIEGVGIAALRYMASTDSTSAEEYLELPEHFRPLADPKALLDNVSYTLWLIDPKLNKDDRSMYPGSRANDFTDEQSVVLVGELWSWMIADPESALVRSLEFSMSKEILQKAALTLERLQKCSPADIIEDLDAIRMCAEVFMKNYELSRQPHEEYGELSLHHEAILLHDVLALISSLIDGGEGFKQVLTGLNAKEWQNPALFKKIDELFSLA